jgi:hypothetical protein
MYEYFVNTDTSIYVQCRTYYKGSTTAESGFNFQLEQRFFSCPRYLDRLRGLSSLSKGYRGLFPWGVKRPRREANRLSPTSAKVTKVGHHTFTPPYVLKAWYFANGELYLHQFLYDDSVFRDSCKVYVIWVSCAPKLNSLDNSGLIYTPNPKLRDIRQAVLKTIHMGGQLTLCVHVTYRVRNACVSPKIWFIE